jgi:hypothetical protein
VFVPSLQPYSYVTSENKLRITRHPQSTRNKGFSGWLKSLSHSELIKMSSLSQGDDPSAVTGAIITPCIMYDVEDWILVYYELFNDPRKLLFYRHYVFVLDLFHILWCEPVLRFMERN